MLVNSENELVLFITIHVGDANSSTTIDTLLTRLWVTAQYLNIK